MAKKKKDHLKEIKEVVDKLWPKTKKELESAMKSAKKFMAKGEKYLTKKELDSAVSNVKKFMNRSEAYLKKVSIKGVKETKKFSLGLKKEKAFHDLGKAVSSISPSRWPIDEKVSKLLKQIKGLNSQIKKINNGSQHNNR